MIRRWKWVYYYKIVRNSLCHWKQWINTHANAAGWGCPVSNINKLIEYANRELANVDFSEGSYDVDFICESKDDYISDLIYTLEPGSEFWG